MNGDQSKDYLASLQQQLAILEDSPNGSALSDKGKGKATERPTWSITGETPIYDALNSHSATRSSRFGGANGSHRDTLPPLSAISGSNRSFVNESYHPITAEARRLQMQEAQDAQSRELALQLDREERRNATRRHSYEPPMMFESRSEAGSLLPSVGSFAGAVVGFVGNRLPAFGRSTTTESGPSTSPRDSKTSVPVVRRPSSISTPASNLSKTNNPISDMSNDYLRQLKRQVESAQNTKSVELALRLQLEEEEIAATTARQVASSMCFLSRL